MEERSVEVEKVNAIGIFYSQARAFTSIHGNSLRAPIHGNKDVYDDCNHPDGCHFYVRQPGHEFKHLTEEFIRGYITGFCTVTHWKFGGAFDLDEYGFDCRDGTASSRMVGWALTRWCNLPYR